MLPVYLKTFTENSLNHKSWSASLGRLSHTAQGWRASQSEATLTHTPSSCPGNPETLGSLTAGLCRCGGTHETQGGAEILTVWGSPGNGLGNTALLVFSLHCWHAPGFRLPVLDKWSGTWLWRVQNSWIWTELELWFKAGCRIEFRIQMQGSRI